MWHAPRWKKNFYWLCVLFSATFSVSCSGFLCSNRQCIPFSDRCDSTQDCTDGSDESECGKLLTEPHTLKPTWSCLLTRVVINVNTKLKYEYLVSIKTSLVMNEWKVKSWLLLGIESRAPDLSHYCSYLWPTITRQPTVLTILYLYCIGSAGCFSHTRSSHSVCVVWTPCIMARLESPLNQDRCHVRSSCLSWK